MVVAGSIAACTLTSGLSDFDSEDSPPDAAHSDAGDASSSAADARDGTFDPNAGVDAPTTAFCAGPSTATSTIYCEDFETKPELVWEPETVGASSIVRLAARPGGGTGNAIIDRLCRGASASQGGLEARARCAGDRSLSLLVSRSSSISRARRKPSSSRSTERRRSRVTCSTLPRESAISRVGITYANETTIAGHVFMDDVLLETLP